MVYYLKIINDLIMCIQDGVMLGLVRAYNYIKFNINSSDKCYYYSIIFYNLGEGGQVREKK